MSVSAGLLDIYRRLGVRYGPQHWWPGETPFEIMVGAVLTQAASWANVEKSDPVSSLLRVDSITRNAASRSVCWATETRI